VDYLGEPPPIRLEVYEDASRSILAENDSPDVGFRWSLNPYRGCFHGCSYCMVGDTPILMGNGRTKPLADIEIGDEIYGTVVEGRYRRYVKTLVLDHWSSIKPAYRVRVEDGTELITSGDHRFLTTRGWKHVTGTEQGSARRPHLARGQRLLGVGQFATPPVHDTDYRAGYLCGLVRGDALLGRYDYSGRRRAREVQHQFRLALADLEPLLRAERYLSEVGVAVHRMLFSEARPGYRAMYAIRTHAERRVERIRHVISWPVVPTASWSKGFLSGIFDAEGCYSAGILRISNKDQQIIDRVVSALAQFGFRATVECRPNDVQNVRIRGGLREHLRFFHTVDTAITRKRNLEGQAIKHKVALRVSSIEPLGIALRLFDITTGTGDFIANGVVSHNCYARPSHEYLGFGAGTDFERRIVVKPRAAELLRQAFDAPSWKGELIVVSGNTDCYQPLEASYGLTRACLEVMAEYRNAAHIITKSPLVERDIDVLLRLRDAAHAGVSVSIPFWDEANARAIEPYVATPQRRMLAVRRLSSAGIHVTVNVAPVIPGLNDQDIGAILEAAAEAGARSAAFILVRLPGSVKEVFTERLREALPLRADKVLARTREVRGGKLNDPRFHSRMTGSGEYADAVRQLFETTARRLGLDTGCEGREAPQSTFRRPTDRGGQLRLFD
jgi:DNA repair photolyase